MKHARQKQIRPPKDPAYLAQVARLPCCVCDAFGMVQTSPTQVHHPICGRYDTRRAPDCDAMPLCKCHHQGLRDDRDESKLAIHRGKDSWELEYGPDTAFIEQTGRRVAELDHFDSI